MQKEWEPEEQRKPPIEEWGIVTRAADNIPDVEKKLPHSPTGFTLSLILSSPAKK